MRMPEYLPKSELAKTKALDFGTLSAFRIVRTRLAHETDEVKSAIAHQYMKAGTSEQIIDTAKNESAKAKSQS